MTTETERQICIVIRVIMELSAVKNETTRFILSFVRGGIFFILEIHAAVIASGKSEICQSRHFTTYYVALEFDLSRFEQSFPPDGETLI